MKKITVQLQWSPGVVHEVGQLAEVDRRVYFEYSADFLQRGLHLSPFKLPSRPGLIEHTDRRFGRLPGLFDDALPDGWGLLLMNRVFRKRGLDPDTLSPLDRLSDIGTRAMGAMTFHPAEAMTDDGRLLDLHKLGRNARAVLAGSATQVLPELARAGGSPGGARPKVLVGLGDGGQMRSGEDDLPDGFTHWMVKFAAREYGPDAGRVEQAYADMARAAGLDVPETRLFPVTKTQSHFGVRRFDRGPANHRLHVHTFANLIHADFRVPSTDYEQLLRVTSALTRNRPDVLRAFRLMVFNIAAHNRDDHAKNFAFVMAPAGQWTLSPAYDLTYSPGPGGEHATTVVGEGRSPGRDHVLRVAERADVSAKEADRIIAEVRHAVASWTTFAAAAGCSKKRVDAIAVAHRLVARGC